MQHHDSSAFRRLDAFLLHHFECCQLSKILTSCDLLMIALSSERNYHFRPTLILQSKSFTRSKISPKLDLKKFRI